MDARVVEEKSTKKPHTYYFDPRARAQWGALRLLVRRGVRCLWAVRWKSGARMNRWEFWEVWDGDPRPLKRGTGRTLDQEFGVAQ